MARTAANSNPHPFVFTSSKKKSNTNNINSQKDPVKSSTLSLGTPIAAASSSTFSTLLRDQHPNNSQHMNQQDRKPKISMFPSKGILNPKQHLSFVALSVGFLLIWTSVISGLLLSSCLTDKAMTDDSEAIFNGHQDVGKVLFALGHEMVSTVDLLLSQDSRSDMIGYSKEALQITWQMTDVILNQVIANNHMKLATHLQFPYERWMEFRGRSISFKTDPRDAVNLYLLVSRDLEKHYQKFTPSSIYYSPSNALKTPFVNTGVSYSLLNSGLFQRFGEIALGTCYMRSLLLINHTEFLDLQFASRALIEAAFQFHPRAQQRYYELRSSNDADQIEEALSIVRQDILTGGRNRNNSLLAQTYLEGVKNEIAQLLLTKDYLNTTIYHQIKMTSQQTRSTFIFYLSVTIIALIAVLSCLALLCCSLRSLSLRAKYPPPRERIVYKANTYLPNHGQQHPSNDLRSRSQTLPIETISYPFNIGVSVDAPVTHQNSQSHQHYNSNNHLHQALSGRQTTNQLNIPASNQKTSSSPFIVNNNDNKQRCFF